MKRRQSPHSLEAALPPDPALDSGDSLSVAPTAPGNLSAPRLQRLTAEITTHLLRLPDSELNSGLRSALQKVVLEFDVERAQILVLSRSGRLPISHSWQRPEVPVPSKAPATSAKLEWLVSRLKHKEIVTIDAVRDLPRAASKEREFLTRLGIHSTVILPLSLNDELRGALTLDMLSRPRTWELEHLVDIHPLTEVLAATLLRRHDDTTQRIKEEWLQLAQRAGRSLVWEWDLDTDAMHLSDSAVEIFGFAAQAVPQSGRELMRYIPEPDQDAIHDALRACMRGERPYIVEHRVNLSIGMRWLAVRGQLFHGTEAGASILGVSTDITEHRLAEEALQREQTRAQVTLASIADGVIRTDAVGLVDYLNPIAEELTGFTKEDARGRPIAEIYHVVDEITRESRPDPVERCLQFEQVVIPPGKSLLLSRTGPEFAVRDSAAPIRDAQGNLTGAVLVTQDVTQLRTLEREMTFLARHDPLTGLINRREFESQVIVALEEAHKGEHQHALCYLDLDEFKVVNDTCGHVAGDEMLRQLTAVLDLAVRDSDVLARLGGDEFGVLLKDCEAQPAGEVAQKLCATIRQFRFTWEEHLFNVGVSIGIVPLDKTSGSLDQVLSAADAACYVAKDRGRGRVHLYQPNDEALARRYGEMQWVERIHHAFANDRFRLFHQPIIEISKHPERNPASARPLSNAPPMAEILIRMLGDDEEPITAAAFIGAAERYHLIGLIDRWVVRRALETIAKDRSSTVFTINLSGHSLGDASFLTFVEEIIHNTQIDTQRVCFEITETAAITNLTRARILISSLRRKGCRFVLDDFGTGLSSFAYLRTLTVDFLKIDGEFIRHMVDEPIERALVESIDQIGHLLGLSTIAESVEDKGTLQELSALGVDYAQGFHVGAPVLWEPTP